MKTIGETFRDVAVRKLTQMAGRIDTCLSKLDEEQVWSRGSENENSIGNLILHLCGNLGQYALHGVGGAPDTRQRDGEFNARGGLSIDELRRRLASRVAEAVAVVESTPDEKLTTPIHVQNYHITVLEALFHTTEHFSHHAGQIIFATKLLTSQELGFYTHLKNPAHGEKTP